MSPMAHKTLHQSNRRLCCTLFLLKCSFFIFPFFKVGFDSISRSFLSSRQMPLHALLFSTLSLYVSSRCLLLSH